MTVHLTWMREAVHTASLGHRAMDKLRLGVFHVRRAFATRLRLERPHSVSAHLKPDGQRVTITGDGELAVLQDILVTKEYATAGQPRVVFDLGANVGFASIFFRRSFPAARIFAVEADPLTYPRLVRNVAGLDITTLHRAATGKDGAVAFYSCSSSISSSMSRRWDSDIEHEVPASSLRTLMDEAGVGHVDLLKIDIEGAEFDLLRAAPLERVGAIVAEVHYDLGDGDEAALRGMLEGFDLRFEPLPFATRNRSLMRATRRAAAREPMPMREPARVQPELR
jgi:FkbM family methyltransferase